jgi:hypothetical protein
MISTQRTIEGMETQWFSVSKEVQNTTVIKQGADIYWDKGGILLVENLEKGFQYYVTFLGKLKQQLVSKCESKLF